MWSRYKSPDYCLLTNIRCLDCPPTSLVFPPQAGFRVGPDHPAATAALEGRVLPLVCADIDLVAAGQLDPPVGVREDWGFGGMS